MNNWPTCLRRDGRGKVPFNTWSACWIFFVNGIWLRMRRIASARKAVSFLEARNLGVAVGGDHDGCVDAFVYAGFEEERYS